LEHFYYYFGGKNKFSSLCTLLQEMHLLLHDAIGKPFSGFLFKNSFHEEKEGLTHGK
jgi:hypothetical protein